MSKEHADIMKKERVIASKKMKLLQNQKLLSISANIYQFFLEFEILIWETLICQ